MVVRKKGGFYVAGWEFGFENVTFRRGGLRRQPQIVRWLAWILVVVSVVGGFLNYRFSKVT